MEWKQIIRSKAPPKATGKLGDLFNLKSLENTVRYLGVEVEDALEVSEQMEV